MRKEILIIAISTSIHLSLLLPLLAMPDDDFWDDRGFFYALIRGLSFLDNNK